MLYLLKIDYPPVAWTAPRVGRRNTFSTHTPHLEEIARLMQEQWVRSYHKEPPKLSCPLKAYFCFFVPIPTAWSKKKKEEAKKGNILAAKRPDRSNYVKLTEDALTRAGIICDDSIIVQATSRKLYSDKPCITLSLQEVHCLYDLDSTT